MRLSMHLVRLFQPWVFARVVAVEVVASGRHAERVYREVDRLIRQAPGLDHPCAAVVAAMTLRAERNEVGPVGKQLALFLFRIALGPRHLPQLMLGNDVMQRAYSVAAGEADHQSAPCVRGTPTLLRIGTSDSR